MRESMSACARRLILEGKTDDEVLQVLIRDHGLVADDKRSKYPAWYRAKIEREQRRNEELEGVAAKAAATAASPESVMKLIQPQVDALLKELREKFPTAQPKPIEVHIEGVKDKKVLKGAHFLMPRLLKLLGAGLHVYLWGPAGTGKTTAARQAAEALGRDAEIDTLDPSTFRSMVQGYMTPKGEPVHTTFTRCWTEGKVYVADELDNAPGHVQTLFNSALANDMAPLAWGNADRAKRFGFVGTGNTPGRPTRDFPDRRPMSSAFMDRMYFLYWPLDENVERRAAGLPEQSAPMRATGRCTPQQWVTYVQRLRAWAKTNAPTLMVTPRASLTGLQALALGETPMEVADGLIFRGADEELKTKASYAVKLEMS